MKTLVNIKKDSLEVEDINWQRMGVRRKEEVIQVYRNIFGGPPWNEGAYCQKEGWGKRISLEEYRKRLRYGDLKCSCGGTFVPCYPRAEVEKIINGELENKKQKPLARLIRREKEIVGFVFAGIIKINDLVEKISGARSDGDVNKGRYLLKGLKRILESKGLKNILYCYEIGIKKEERKGIVPLSLLIKGLFMHGEKNNVFSGIFWTKKTNSIYRISYLAGFRPVYKVPDSRTNEEIFFLLNLNFKPILNNLLKYRHPAIALIKTNEARY